MFVQFNLKCCQGYPSLFITAYCLYFLNSWNELTVFEIKKSQIPRGNLYLSISIYWIVCILSILNHTVWKFVCTTKCSTEKQIKYYQNKYIYKMTNIIWHHSVISTETFLSGFSFRNWNTSYASISCLSSFIFYFFLKKGALFYILSIGVHKTWPKY